MEGILNHFSLRDSRWLLRSNGTLRTLGTLHTLRALRTLGSLRTAGTARTLRTSWAARTLGTHWAIWAHRAVRAHGTLWTVSARGALSAHRAVWAHGTSTSLHASDRASSALSHPALRTVWAVRALGTLHLSLGAVGALSLGAAGTLNLSVGALGTLRAISLKLRADWALNIIKIGADWALGALALLIIKIRAAWALNIVKIEIRALGALRALKLCHIDIRALNFAIAATEVGLVLRAALEDGNVGSVERELSDNTLQEAIELRVSLDLSDALAVTADNSVKFLFNFFIIINDGRSLYIEGKVLLLDDLVDIEAELSGVNNLTEDLVLNSVVSDVGNEGSLGNGGNFLVVVGIDVLDVVGGILHDLFDLLSGVTRVRLFLDDLGGLVVGVVHNLIDLLLLLSLSLLDLLLLSLVVDLSDQLEALLDLLNNGLDLLGRGLNGKGVGDLEGVVVDVTDVVLVDDGDGTLGHLLLDLIRKVGDQLSLTLPRGLDGTVLNTDCRDRTEEKGNRERVHLCFYVSS